MLSVSVAMATYNGALYLRRQLDSIAAQSYAPAELVVVDDGSSDETLSVVAAFAKDAPFPVHVYRNETRLGFRGNFMRAASLCNSDLIAFCDQDDYWYPHKIKVCVERFSEPDILLVYHNADVVTLDGKRIDRLDKFALGQPFFSSGPLAHSRGFTQTFRRFLLKFSSLWMTSLDYFQPGEPLAHDQWIFFLASALGKISYLDEPLVAYVQHGNNLFGSPFVDLPQKMESFFLSGSQFSLLSKCLERRGAILDSAQTELDDPWRERAQITAKDYQRLSRDYAKRSAIYMSTKFGDRLKALRELLATGAYERAWTKKNWGLSRKSLVKDLCLGVALGPFLKSLRNAPDV